MKRSFFLLVAWIFYAPLVLVTVLYELIAIDYLFGTEPPSMITLAAMTTPIYTVALMSIPILIRWVLKNTTWGTFAVFMFMLAVALALRGVHHQALQNMVFAIVFALLSVAALLSAGYFMYRNVRHIKALVQHAHTRNRLR